MIQIVINLHRRIYNLLILFSQYEKIKQYIKRIISVLLMRFNLLNVVFLKNENFVTEYKFSQ
jgi:hypothetical protein